VRQSADAQSKQAIACDGEILNKIVCKRNQNYTQHLADVPDSCEVLSNYDMKELQKFN